MSKGKTARSTIAYILLGIEILFFALYVYFIVAFYKLTTSETENSAQAVGVAFGAIFILVAVIISGIATIGWSIPVISLLSTVIKGTPKPKKIIDIILLVIAIALVVVGVTIFIILFLTHQS